MFPTLVTSGFPRRAARRNDLALVSDLQVEHREERLIAIAAVAPVRRLSEIVPDRERRAELIVGLRAIAGEVASGSQVFGKRLDVKRGTARYGPGSSGTESSVVRMCCAPIAV
jgi:hypothetical protein